MTLPFELVALLESRALCFITTLMPDGSPQTTETWVDTDGENVVVNTVQGYQKLRNIDRDPRVTVAVCDPVAPTRYFEIRGRVTTTTTDGGVEHIEKLSQKYSGAPYPWYGGRAQVRVIMTIEPTRVRGMGGR